jgi:hypothetical protein
MDALTRLHPLAFPLGNHLMVVIAPQAGRTPMLELAARLALAGPLLVLDGGNQFNVYPVAHVLRRQTADLTAILRRIRMARAFTCYQMSALLADTHAASSPVMVLDLLSTFYDENVTLAEAQRLLSDGLRHLQRLSRAAPVIVSSRPPGMISADRLPLVEQLTAAADQVWQVEQPQPSQPARAEWY